MTADRTVLQRVFEKLSTSDKEMKFEDFLCFMHHYRPRVRKPMHVVYSKSAFSNGL